MSYSIVPSQQAASAPAGAARPVPRAAPTLPGGRSAYLGAVRVAWRRARAGEEPRADALALALRVFARDGRARGATVESLLRALDGVVRSVDGPEADDADRVRDWAGTQVIRAYYCDD